MPNRKKYKLPEEDLLSELIDIQYEMQKIAEEIAVYQVTGSEVRRRTASSMLTKVGVMIKVLKNKIVKLREKEK